MNYSNIVGYKFFAADHARILRGTDAQVGLPFGGKGDLVDIRLDKEGGALKAR